MPVTPSAPLRLVDCSASEIADAVHFLEGMLEGLDLIDARAVRNVRAQILNYVAAQRHNNNA